MHIRVGEVVFDEGDRREDLERRAGGVALGDRAVEQGVVRVRGERGECVGHRAGVGGGQLVRVEGR